MSRNYYLNPIVNMTFGPFNGDDETITQTVGGDMTGNQTIIRKIHEGHTTGQEGRPRIDRDQAIHGGYITKLKASQMIIASDLKIEHSQNSLYWKWVKDPRATRFTEVAELLEVWYFHIKTSMNFLALSANTKYGAYLIFKTTEDSEGLDAIMNTSVSVGRNQEEKYVCLKPTMATPRSVVRPEEWSDEWLELELGQFYCDNVTNKEALIIIQEKSDHIRKAGLIVAGVEIRPI